MYMASASLALVSCICITKNDIRLIDRAVSCYNNQTYLNTELVILFEDNNPHKTYISNLQNIGRRIKTIEIPSKPKKTLGELRNIAIEQSSGAYFIQWDDDDWYHSKRIDIQMAAIKSGPHKIVALQNWYMFDETDRKLYLSVDRTWEGSILCEREFFDTTSKYPSLNKAEDTKFIESVSSKVKIITCPHIYIYVFHSSNTWDREHWLYLRSRTAKCDESLSNIIGDMISFV
jgi:glycosyltransferase involved in cell wall biosynthesis